VAYDGVYPGVDLVFYVRVTRSNTLHHCAEQIRNRSGWRSKLSKIQLDEKGSLNLEAGGDKLSMSSLLPIRLGQRRASEVQCICGCRRSDD